MKNSKLGLKALGLAVMGVLSMTAIFAAGAQAQGTLGEFLVDLDAELAVGAEVEGTLDAGLLWGQLLVAGRNINIKCKTGGATGTITGKKHGLGTFTFGGCLVFSHPADAQLTVCTVHSTGQANGTITAGALLLPILHGTNDLFVLAEAKEVAGKPGTFTTIEILGASCAVRGTYPTKGSVVALVLDNDTVSPLLDLSEAIQLLVGDVLEFGAFKAYINSEVLVELIGPEEDSLLAVD